MPKKSKQSGAGVPPSGTRGEKARGGAKAPPAGAPVVDPGDRDEEILREFVEASARAYEVLVRWVDGIEHVRAEFRVGADYDRQIESVKASKAAVVKVHGMVERLKKAINLTLGDLRWARGLLDPAGADADRF